MAQLSDSEEEEHTPPDRLGQGLLKRDRIMSDDTVMSVHPLEEMIVECDVAEKLEDLQSRDWTE